MLFYLRSLILAFQFFTRIPIPLNIPFEAATLKQGTLALPFIGAVLGALVWCFGMLMNIMFPPMVAASLTLTFCVYATGGLHWDGLLDTADGVYSQRTGSEMLKVITDSRVGAFGAIVGILMLILKFSLFYALFSANQFSVLIALPMIWSRFMLIVTIVNKPYYVEEAGIGGLYDGMGRKHIVFTFSLALVLSIIIWLVAHYINGISIYFMFKLCIAMILGNIIVMQIISRQLIKQLGGLTGDGYGAINEVCEIMSLLILLSFLV